MDIYPSAGNVCLRILAIVTKAAVNLQLCEVMIMLISLSVVMTSQYTCTSSQVVHLKYRVAPQKSIRIHF